MMANYCSFRQLKVAEELPGLDVPGLLIDQRVPLELLNDDLKIRIYRFSGLKEGDEFKLYIRNVYAGSSYTVSKDDQDNPEFEVNLYITKNQFPSPGSFASVPVDYEYIDSATGEGTRSGKPVTVIFDREAPGGASLRGLSFTEAQKEGISAEDIIDGNLPVSGYAWYGMEEGDILTPWVSDSPPSSGSETEFLIKEAEIHISTPGSTTEVKFPVSNFSGTGDRYFAYQLRDKLGNTSSLSPTVKVSVDL